MIQVSPESVDLVAKMTEEMGPRLSRNEIGMIKKMAAKETGDALTSRDVRIMSEIVKAMGGGGDDGLTDGETKLVAVVSKVAAKGVVHRLFSRLNHFVIYSFFLLYSQTHPKRRHPTSSRWR